MIPKIDFDSMSDDVLIQLLISLSEKDRQELCKMNNHMNKVCKENEEYIYFKLIKNKFKVKTNKDIYRLLNIQYEALDENDINMKNWFESMWPGYLKRK